MGATSQSYLMVLPVPAYRIDDSHFAIESAFAEHLRLLKGKLGSMANAMVIAAPTLSDADYESSRSHLGVINENAEGIRFHSMYPAKAGRAAYLRRLPGVMRELYREVKQAGVVHAGPSTLYRPFEFPSLMMGCALGKKTISVTDIDFRRSARMYYEAGHGNLKEYLVTKLLHHPYLHAQHLVCARLCSLVLLKGGQMAQDYGRGRANVKDFLDSAYSSSHIITPDALETKLKRLADPTEPIDITFFGRLVQYKGIDHMLRALAFAKQLGLRGFRFQIVGSGDAEVQLRSLTIELGLKDEVVFHGALPFGEAFFERLHDYHVLLAAPLSEDTPRSALDAMASGQALVAYDTYYYKDLAAAGAAIELVPWRDEQALGTRIFELCRDRERLARLIRKAAAFAQNNTQEVWLERRVQWTTELCAPSGA